MLKPSQALLGVPVLHFVGNLARPALQHDVAHRRQDALVGLAHGQLLALRHVDDRVAEALDAQHVGSPSVGHRPVERILRQVRLAQLREVGDAELGEISDCNSS